MNKIFEYRSKNNITQAEMAKRMNVSRATIVNWETGKNIPRKKEISAMCDIFNCYPIELMNGDASVFCDYSPKDTKDALLFLEAVKRSINIK